jgi:hypothetical protein
MLGEGRLEVKGFCINSTYNAFAMDHSHTGRNQTRARHS